MQITRDYMMQNLTALGLAEEEIQQSMSFYDRNDFRDVYAYLRSIRCNMLEDVHQVQQKLDQLDYLLFNLKKYDESENE